MGQSVRIQHFGPPEVMSLEAFEPGAPGVGELLIRQTAIGVNFSDHLMRAGEVPAPLPSGIGIESAGVVLATGPGTAGFSVGDRVVCVGPRPDAYADVRLAPVATTLKLPDGVTEDLAAAATIKGLTAEYLVRRAYPVQAGETVLFHAAAGGVGLIACQWLKALGATVIGTVGSDEKVDIARDHGCDHVINYRASDFVAAVREITEGRGVSVVYDSVGKDTFTGSLDCLRPRGVLVSFGGASGPVEPFDLRLLTAKGSLYVTRSGLGHYISTREDLEASATALFEVLGQGAVKVKIGARFALADAAQAHHLLAGRGSTGSIILLP